VVRWRIGSGIANLEGRGLKLPPRQCLVRDVGRARFRPRTPTSSGRGARDGIAPKFFLWVTRGWVSILCDFFDHNQLIDGYFVGQGGMGNLLEMLLATPQAENGGKYHMIPFFIWYHAPSHQNSNLQVF
jgi:hypothetical protein